MKELPSEIYEKIALVQVYLSIPGPSPRTAEIILLLEEVLEAIKAYEQKPKNIA